MSLVMFALWVLVGLLAGWLAGIVMKRGGYGLRWDVILGVTGGILGSWLFWALGVSPEAGMITLAVVAFVGAALPNRGSTQAMAHHRLGAVVGAALVPGPPG